MKKQLFAVMSMIISLLLLSPVFAATWPADSSGTELAGGLGVYEPSGAVWHSRLGQLFVVSDEGLISKMNPDGSSVTTWSIGGDLEGIAIADASSNYIYVINEYPFALYQFDISTGTKTKTWDLSNVGIPAPTNTSYGLEGMTYIPSEDYSTSNGRGVFAVGSQETGTIYFLDVDTSTSGGSVTLLRSMTPAGAWISDLFYDRETNVLYVLYDSTLVEMNLQGAIAATYTVPGSDQEGVTLTTACSSTTTTTTATIYIASDTPASVKKYGNYPVNCPVVTTTPPATTDPNLISSETISGATITVNYADGHVQQLTPYSTPTVQAAVNYDSTRLITSNGKYVSVYKNGALMTKAKVSSYTPSTYTLSVTHGTSSDTVAVSYTRSNKLITVTYTLQNDILTRVSTTSTSV